MTYNLTNRPKHDGFGLLGEYEKWFEGFEAQQRFLLTKNNHGMSQVAVMLYKAGKLGLDPVQAIEWFIKKQLLGLEEEGDQKQWSDI